MLHEGSERKPQTVKNAEVIGRIGWSLRILGLFAVVRAPLVRTESADEEEHDAHADVSEHDAHPDLIRQRVQEGEHAGFRLLRLLYHDRDPKAHEGFGEVDHLLAHQRDGQRSHGDVCSLEHRRTAGAPHVTLYDQETNNHMTSNDSTENYFILILLTIINTQMLIQMLPT